MKWYMRYGPFPKSLWQHGHRSIKTLCTRANQRYRKRRHRKKNPSRLVLTGKAKAIETV